MMHSTLPSRTSFNFTSLVMGLMTGLIGVMLCAPTAHGVVAVTHDTAAPSQGVIASYTGAGPSGYQWRDNETSERDVGQSFLAPASVLMDAFSLEALGNVQAGTYNAPFTLTVYESNDPTAIGSAISIQSGTYIDNSSNPIDPGWLTFDIDYVQLTGGNYYTVMLSWDNAGVTDQDQVFAVVNPGGYAGGYLWEYDGTTYSRHSSDYNFSVQIPEPSAVALLMLGTMAFVGRRRNEC